MRKVSTLTLKEAKKILDRIENEAQTDGDIPVAAAVVGSDARLIAFIAMDGVKTVGIRLAADKAYTAVIGTRDTIECQERAEKTAGFNISNYTDRHFTGIVGGVVLKDSDGNIVGGVGVSGRNPTKKGMPRDTTSQDHELALFARDVAGLFS